MDVHLLDGTYELFRHYFALPGRENREGMEIDAARGVVNSMLMLLEDGATHVGVATDHVIESFRNDLWAGYKRGEGIDPLLFDQFPILEGALTAFGFPVWAMVDLEADDAMASAAAVATADERVERALLCTPDKDLGQCVGGKVVQFDRRKGVLLDASAIRAKFGVGPESITDFLALVGDTADGFPGLPGWGAKSASTVLARWVHVEDIPSSATDWGVTVRGAAKLSVALEEGRELAALFKVLATLRLDAEVGEVDDWEWRGPANDVDEWAAFLDADAWLKRVESLTGREPERGTGRGG